MKHDKKKQWLSIGLLTLGAAALAVFLPIRRVLARKNTTCSRVFGSAELFCCPK